MQRSRGAGVPGPAQSSHRDALAPLPAGADDRLAGLSDRLDRALQGRLMTALAAPAGPKKEWTRYLYSADLLAVLEFAIARRAPAARGPWFPLDPAMIAQFLAQPSMRPFLPKSDRAASAISTIHRVLGLPNPCRSPAVRAVRIARRRGQKPSVEPRAGSNSPRHLRCGGDVIVDCLSMLRGNDLATLRDRCLLLLGFAGALRSSDLAALTVEELTITEESLIIARHATRWRILREPATPNAERICAVRATERWLAAADITEGPVFRGLRAASDGTLPPLSVQLLSRVFKTIIARTGRNPAEFSLGSLRAGLLSAAQQYATGPFEGEMPTVALGRTHLSFALD